MSESIDNKIPSPATVINSADVVIDDKASLNFPLLSQVQEIKEQIKQDAHHKINPTAQAELLKAVNHLSSLTINKIALYFSPETTKTAIHKQAIELCLKNNANGYQQAESLIKQSENKLITLKTEFEQIKQAIATIEGLLKNPVTYLVSHQQKISQNMADIKALELTLEPTLTKLHFTVLAAQAIDPSLIKQVFDPKQQTPEYIVLNKDSYVDTIGLFVKASQIMQHNSNDSKELAELNEVFSQKLAAYHKIKAIHEAFKQSHPNIGWADQEESDRLGNALELAIKEHNDIKAQIKPIQEKIAQAEKYLKYYQNWSEQSQKEINAAKLIETKKHENIELSKQMQSNVNLDTQIEHHLEKLAHTEDQIKTQQKIVLDNQILLNAHQEITEYLQSETAQKLLTPATHEAEIITDAAPVMAHTALPEAWTTQISSTEPQL